MQRRRWSLHPQPDLVTLGYLCISQHNVFHHKCASPVAVCVLSVSTCTQGTSYLYVCLPALHDEYLTAHQVFIPSYTAFTKVLSHPLALKDRSHSHRFPHSRIKMAAIAFKWPADRKTLPSAEELAGVCAHAHVRGVFMCMRVQRQLARDVCGTMLPQWCISGRQHQVCPCRTAHSSQ